jgi:hypothetical protein
MSKFLYFSCFLLVFSLMLDLFCTAFMLKWNDCMVILNRVTARRLPHGPLFKKHKLSRLQELFTEYKKKHKYINIKTIQSACNYKIKTYHPGKRIPNRGPCILDLLIFSNAMSFFSNFYEHFQFFKMFKILFFK